MLSPCAPYASLLVCTLSKQRPREPVTPVTQQPRNIRHALRLRLSRRLCGGSETATRLLLCSGFARVARRRLDGWLGSWPRVARVARRAHRDKCGDCGDSGDCGDGGDGDQYEDAPSRAERHLPSQGPTLWNDESMRAALPVHCDAQRNGDAKREPTAPGSSRPARSTAVHVLQHTHYSQERKQEKARGGSR